MTRGFSCARTLFTVITAGAILFLPRVVTACSVCFGAPDSPQTQGVRYAVLFLLFVVAGVLSCILAFFVYLVRRAKIVAASSMTRDEFDRAMNPVQDDGLSHW